MEGLLTWVEHAVKGTPAVALAVAFIWGILSILCSPCHLASIPLIVGFIDRQGTLSTRRAFVISTLFAVGIFVTIAVIAVITDLLGRMKGDVGFGPYGNYFMAAILFVVGLHLLDVIPLPFSGPSQIGFKRKGALAALIIGLVFGIALGPCTFAYLAPMLVFTYSTAATERAYGYVLLLAYGVGHCSVIVLAGTFTSVVQRYLKWSERSRGSVYLRWACGVLVLLGGLYMIYTAP